MENENVRYNQASKELKDNFKTVDDFITEENVNSHFKYGFIPKKNESHLTKFIAYDLETHNTDKTRPYDMTLYRLGKLAGRYNRDLTTYEYDKGKNDTSVFAGLYYRIFRFFIKIQAKERKTIINKIVQFNLQLPAHDGSGFDTWIILNNHPCDNHIVDII